MADSRVPPSIVGSPPPNQSPVLRLTHAALGFATIGPSKVFEKFPVSIGVIHEAMDFRVVDTQGLSTFNALQRLGIDSKLLCFPDESHWVLKPANCILWHETVIGWLSQWLKNNY